MPAHSAVNIGLLGGSSSGKTTYLATLRIATLLDEKTGDWRADGIASKQPDAFLTKATEMLEQRQFPEATDSVQPHAFRLRGYIEPPPDDRALSLGEILGLSRLRDTIGLGRLFRGQQRYRSEPATSPMAEEFIGDVTAIVQVLDCPGRIYYGTSNCADEFYSYLAACEGLVYLYDPLLDMTPIGNFRYLQAPVDCLAQRMGAQNQRLPQYLAVCISKFDDPRIFKPLQDRNLVSIGSNGIPSVEDGQAAFEMFADRLTKRTISKYFWSDRTTYFVTSSIGFYEKSEGVVNLNDYVNVENADGQKPTRIRGKVSPVNVLAPLVWIVTRVAQEKSGNPTAT